MKSIFSMLPLFLVLAAVVQADSVQVRSRKQSSDQIEVTVIHGKLTLFFVISFLMS
jgi:hypothetical protein